MSHADYRITLHDGRTLGIGPRRWWWRIESTQNGQALAHSENYSSEAKRDQTATRVAYASGFKVRDAKSDVEQ